MITHFAKWMCQAKFYFNVQNYTLHNKYTVFIIQGG